MLFFDLVLLFSYRISHSYARSSFSRLQREVTLHFHFCQFFIISALVLEPLFRHLYTGKPKLWTHMKITFFFDIFAFFRWILLFFFSFWCSVFGIRRAACRNLRLTFKLDIFEVLTLNFTIFDRFFTIFQWNLRMFHHVFDSSHEPSIHRSVVLC